MLVVPIALVTILTILNGSIEGKIIYYLIFIFIVTVLLVMLANMITHKLLLNIAIKSSYKFGDYKEVEGEYICKFNDDFLEINDKQYRWTDFSLVSTDAVYVFMYINNFEKVVVFPKYPEGLSFDERDKLNQIIQNRFNVNIRL